MSFSYYAVQSRIHASNLTRRKPLPCTVAASKQHYQLGKSHLSTVVDIQKLHGRLEKKSQKRKCPCTEEITTNFSWKIQPSQTLQNDALTFLRYFCTAESGLHILKLSYDFRKLWALRGILVPACCY